MLGHGLPKEATDNLFLAGNALWAVILAALFSTLVAFGVLDTRNRAIWVIGDFLYRATDPVLRPARGLNPVAWASAAYAMLPFARSASDTDPARALLREAAALVDARARCTHGLQSREPEVRFIDLHTR